MGISFPEVWWGTHYLAFLPAGAMWGLLILSAWLIVAPKQLITEKTLAPLYRENGGLKTSLLIGTGIFSVILIYNFPIAFDDYGDAFQNRLLAGETLTDLPAHFYDDLFSFNPLPSAGRKTVLLFYGLISHLGNISYGNVFTIMGVFCGGAYVLSWLFFIRFYIASGIWQIILGLLGIFAPFTQIFYGHLETYALVFFAFTSWLLVLLIYYKNRKTILLWALLPWLFLCIKLHPLCVLLAPAWGMTFIQYRFTEAKWVKKIVSWKGVAIIILLPTFLILTYLYFFLFDDAHDLRNLDDSRAIDHLFLPLFSPEAPLHNYNLFSLNHILDYFNVIISWSAPALFILLSAIFVYRKKINWNDPLLIILGSTLLLFLGILFMINPLVSMPMDWDLFSFPAPLLLLIAVVLIQQTEGKEDIKFSSSSILGILLLATPFFVVNASEAMLANRLETVGTHVYKTYYLHSNRILINSFVLQNDDKAYLERKKVILEELQPLAIPGKDAMYANLLMDDGFYYLRIAKDYATAINQLEKAIYYNPESEDIQNLFEEAKSKLSGTPLVIPEGDPFAALEKEGLIMLRQTGEFQKAKLFFEEALLEYPDDPILFLYLMEANFQLKDFFSAYEYGLKLIEKKFPDEKKAYLIAIHCSIEAGLYDDSEVICRTYLESYPDDERIQKVYKRLQENDELDKLKFLFRK
jgi:tetratricopeptide (TPR) repeat protein